MGYTEVTGRDGLVTIPRAGVRLVLGHSSSGWVHERAVFAQGGAPWACGGGPFDPCPAVQGKGMPRLPLITGGPA